MHRIGKREIEGETIKFTLELPGGVETESVLIPMRRRDGSTTRTLCVSSQVGCAMGCRFCETARMGLVRHLDTSDIVAQWHAATHQIGHRPKNIVFMGDSVVKGVGCRRVGEGPTLPRHVAEVVAEQLGAEVGWRALGETGADIRMLREQFIPLLRREVERCAQSGERVDAVVVVCGLNDIKECFLFVQPVSSVYSNHVAAKISDAELAVE